MPSLDTLRLSQTGKNWRLGQYVMVSVGLTVAMVAVFLFQGFPFLLAITVGLLLGVGLPHMVVSSLIKRRIKKFLADFPEAIARFQTLQTALQATLQTAGQTLNLSLLDFLG